MRKKPPSEDVKDMSKPPYPRQVLCPGETTTVEGSEEDDKREENLISTYDRRVGGKSGLGAID